MQEAYGDFFIFMLIFLDIFAEMMYDIYIIYIEIGIMEQKGEK